MFLTLLSLLLSFMHKHPLFWNCLVVPMNICPCSTDIHSSHETSFCHWNVSLCSASRELKQDKFVLGFCTSSACLRKRVTGSKWEKGKGSPETWSRPPSQYIVSWMRKRSAALCPWRLSHCQFYCKTEQYTHTWSLSGSPNQRFCIAFGKSVIGKKSFSLVCHFRETSSSC